MYSSSAPDELTRWDVIPTLLVSWWCTGCSLAIIFVRVIGRYLRTQVLFPEDWIMLASVIPLLIRMGLVHLVLIYGTNNVIATNLSDIQIRQREIGSGLVLGARIFYSLFIWTAKYTITEFLTRLTAQTWRRSFQLMLNFIRLFLVATFAVVAISTLAECQPFHNYWQVNPLPEPKCRQGYAHLVAMGACDAATDMLLVAFPIPIIVVSTMSIFRKLALTLLFALPLILVVITCYRVPAVIQRQGNQQYRSLFASLEIVVATAISNAIVIGSFMRDRGVKKQKYKIGSVSEASDQKFSRRATITNHEWGSDADLATDIGLRLDLEVKMPTYQEVWPAPIAHVNKRNPKENDFT
ncbi:integral membrane protein, putative [Histoplasma capsulatum G186AR]|uniref:Putative integral membrane protein n=1 Tax=Ajellomyces capsulatus TaxID=5037 RepID=A0A8H7Z0S9_AJECA|nr:putative integral membrane protein [Histoplasma capsulatum]QSS68265.1 integral membrane protein, putative [Histoplasma capsulatum G186AR]